MYPDYRWCIYDSLRGERTKGNFLLVLRDQARCLACVSRSRREQMVMRYCLITCLLLGTAAAQQLPQAPRRGHRELIITSVALGAASSADAETTVRAGQRGGVEGNPFLRMIGGDRPGRPVLYSAMGATDALLIWGSKTLQDHGHRKLWRVPLYAAIGVHVTCIIANLQVERPGRAIRIHPLAQERK